MFKIVASFTRSNTDQEFFNDTYSNYEVIMQIQKNAKQIPGFLGIDEHIHRDDFRCDKALCFENEAAFSQFVEENQQLLFKRNQLIENFCNTTGQMYKYYIIKEDKT
jgi:hypothetical protein